MDTYLGAVIVAVMLFHRRSECCGRRTSREKPRYETRPVVVRTSDLRGRLCAQLPLAKRGVLGYQAAVDSDDQPGVGKFKFDRKMHSLGIRAASSAGNEVRSKRRDAVS